MCSSKLIKIVKFQIFSVQNTVLFINMIVSNFSGYDSGIIEASSFRTYHTPLNKQVMDIQVVCSCI